MAGGARSLGVNDGTFQWIMSPDIIFSRFGTIGGACERGLSLGLNLTPSFSTQLLSLEGVSSGEALTDKAVLVIEVVGVSQEEGLRFSTTIIIK